MKKIIECVPNFSEGRDKQFLQAIEEAIKNVDGVHLLNLEPDADYHRAVCTFVGDEKSVVEAAYQATKVAAKMIDMTKHKGEHPRMGATDVVPFVPVQNASVEDCIRCSREYGRRIAEDLQIPVYLYEEAATEEKRRNLASVRAGQYEGLAEKLQDESWKPDFGEARFNAKSGATITGVRKFLIAYNVNLNSEDLALAKEIAFTLRESGRLKKDAEGNKIFDENGKALRIKGKLKNVKGLGVALPDHGITQVSMNLTDYTITGMEKVYLSCVEEAEKLGISVTGSEAVGLVPEDALLQAGKYFAEASGLDTENSDELLKLAIEKLGLSDLHEFDVNEKVIEKIIANME